MTDASAPNAQSLFLLALLAGQPTPAAFRAELGRLFAVYVETGMEAGWSQAVAEEFAAEELGRAAAVLDAMRAHFVNEAGHA